MSVTISSNLHDKEKQIRIYIEQYADAFDLDPNLIRALITQESRFNAKAVSPTGAYGLGQFTGIGARQVQNIAHMSDCPDPLGLDTFTKRDANEPDIGVKAICATLWWLFNKKYGKVSDKKVQLEAVLTFYNSGGRPANLVVKHGGHDRALPFIEVMPARYRSQSEKYAPEVAMWYIAWHDLLKPKTVERIETTVFPPSDPFVRKISDGMSTKTRALIETLQLLGSRDSGIDVSVDVRDGLTEVTLIVVGEL